MKGRCFNIYDKGFKNYGMRGITVCGRWKNSFAHFLADMGKSPPGYSLDRIDVNGDYSPENCRWVSRKDSTNNRRNTIYIEHQGKRLALGDWARKLGVSYETLFSRVRAHGTSPEKILAPIAKKNALITLDGKSKSAKEWADYLGIKYMAFCKRLSVGTPIDRLLTKGSIHAGKRYINRRRKLSAPRGL